MEPEGRPKYGHPRCEHRSGHPRDEPARTEPSSPSDLLARHCAGDPHAFAELVHRYSNSVYGYLVRARVDKSARDDLFQEVFTKLHLNASRHDSRRPLAPWIFAVTANTVRDHFRRKHPEQLHIAPESLPSPHPGPHALHELHDTATWLDVAIQSLPLNQREVILLAAVQGLALKEVSLALGIPVNTVKTLLRRARLSLARHRARQIARADHEVQP